jgi:predicted AlkP superfamily phosphohydrolase/phosphomutase
VGAVETVDIVQHLMWRHVDPDHPAYDPGLAPRYGNAIDGVYRRVDDLVGQVVARLAPDTVVLVVSGYGVHPFRWSVDLNVWLRAQGHLTLRDGATGGPGWSQVDWARTRAFASGPGQIHVNLRGRESRGIVAPGAEEAALVRAIADALAGLQHPVTGQRIVRRISTRDDLYDGPRASAAPDLQVSFEEGYRAAWPSAPSVDAVPVVSPNTGRWSGDHTSADPLATPGVLISSVAPTSLTRRLIDIAPTVLKYFGVALPKGLDGTPLF